MGGDKRDESCRETVLDCSAVHFPGKHATAGGSVLENRCIHHTQILNTAFLVSATHQSGLSTVVNNDIKVLQNVKLAVNRAFVPNAHSTRHV